MLIKTGLEQFWLTAWKSSKTRSKKTSWTSTPPPPTPCAFLKIERHHPSCQQAPQPWANEENRAALDVLMDAASPSTLVSLAAWRMDGGLDRKRRRRSLTRRLKWLLSLTARLFMFAHHQRAAIDPPGVAYSEAAVTSSPGDGGLGLLFGRLRNVPRIVLWPEKWIKLSSLENVLLCFMIFNSDTLAPIHASSPLTKFKGLFDFLPS